jgi:hypothetical protein
MALSKGTNSYATVEEADSYFEDRIDADAWDSAEDAEKAQALVTASGLLDEKEWTGTIYDEDQDMAWPRTGAYFDPRLGIYAELTTDVPDRIIKATYELAFHLLNNEGVLDSSSTAETIRISTIELTRISSSSVVPSSINRIIRPLLANRGSNAWWRAN